METSPDGQLYSSFADVIGIIFNNWTAIKLAIEHGMGGPPAITQRKLAGLIDTVAQAFASGDVDWYDISDHLVEVVDTEFSTILEDNSSDEVATHLCQLYQMFNAGDHTSLQAALSSLPIKTPINTALLHTLATRSQQTVSSEDEEEEDKDTPEDDGWTVVKRK